MKWNEIYTISESRFILIWKTSSSWCHPPLQEPSGRSLWMAMRQMLEIAKTIYDMNEMRWDDMNDMFDDTYMNNHKRCRIPFPKQTHIPIPLQSQHLPQTYTNLSPPPSPAKTAQNANVYIETSCWLWSWRGSNEGWGCILTGHWRLWKSQQSNCKSSTNLFKQNYLKYLFLQIKIILPFNCKSAELSVMYSPWLYRTAGVHSFCKLDWWMDLKWLLIPSDWTNRTSLASGGCWIRVFCECEGNWINLMKCFELFAILVSARWHGGTKDWM